jgi:hypothetical protein
MVCCKHIRNDLPDIFSKPSDQYASDIMNPFFSQPTVGVRQCVYFQQDNATTHTTLSKKYLTLGRENKVLHLGGYNTQSPSK